MKSLLTESDLFYLLEQQEKLDRDIRKKFSINDAEWIEMNIEHDIALRVEIAEFVNACYKSWKYWKSKGMDREKVLDEAVDVMHFIFLRLNKSMLDINSVARLTVIEINEFEMLATESEVKEVLYNMSVYNNWPEKLLGKLLQILDFYDFDRKQIMQAYKEKNKVNFERLEAGY